jgi:hypothetical protein
MLQVRSTQSSSKSSIIVSTIATMANLLSITRKNHVLFVLGLSVIVYLAFLLRPQSRILQSYFPIRRIPDSGGHYGYVIGIDLGNTVSHVAVSIEGKSIIVPDKDGSTDIPSYVSYSNNGIVVGHSAKLNAAKDPENTIFDIRDVSMFSHSVTITNSYIGVF